MASSPRINFRLSEELAAKLDQEAERRNKSTSETAREIIAKALKEKDLSTVKPRGRKKLSENPEIV